MRSIDSAAGLLAEGWFAEVTGFLDGVRFPARELTVAWTVTAPAGDVTHHQVFRDGRLAWVPGLPVAADLHLRQPLATHLALLTGTGPGDDIVRATEVVDPDTGAGSPPPPLDEVVVDWGGSLPVVPTAGPVLVQQVLLGTPFGDVCTSYRLNRGQVVDASIGSLGEPDVLVVRRYGDALAERAGRLDVVESVQAGQVLGDFRTIALFLGIYDGDECREARRALSTAAADHLVTLGELFSSPAWAALTPRLAEGAVGEMRSVP